VSSIDTNVQPRETLLPGTLTGSGRRQLAVEAREWDRISAAIGRVMKFA
jgi:hypothetical protein